MNEQLKDKLTERIYNQIFELGNASSQGAYTTLLAQMRLADIISESLQEAYNDGVNKNVLKK